MGKAGGTDDEGTSEQAETGGGWFGYTADQHGMPRADENNHLTPEQRSALEKVARATAERRGRHQATVIVQVYESGEAVPSVQFPKYSTLDMNDRKQVNEAVKNAAEALLNWS